MKRLALLLLALPPVVAAQITAGQWEIKVSSSLPDAPTATQALTRCLSAEDSQDPGRLFARPAPVASSSTRTMTARPTASTSCAGTRTCR